MYRLMAIFALSALMALPAEAELQTVRLSVPGMTCPACPITVKKALSRVPGVNAVTVNFENIRTNVVALVRATGDAGYPSTALKTE
jgi:periplasmic mercuric ion binding protein